MDNEKVVRRCAEFRESIPEKYERMIDTNARHESTSSQRRAHDFDFPRVGRNVFVKAIVALDKSSFNSTIISGMFLRLEIEINR